MPQITKGPLSPEDASINYATGLYGRLRCRHGWRRDIFALLCREYDEFAEAANRSDFCMLSMWEYMQLMEVTSRYLRDSGNRNLASWLYVKVCVGLACIRTQMDLLKFDEREKESMRSAFERMEPTLAWWAGQGRARE